MSNLTITEIAFRAGVSERTVAKWIADGHLGSVKVGGRRLVPVDAFDAFLDSTGRRVVAS